MDPGVVFIVLLLAAGGIVLIWRRADRASEQILQESRRLSSATEETRRLLDQASQALEVRTQESLPLLAEISLVITGTGGRYTCAQLRELRRRSIEIADSCHERKQRAIRYKRTLENEKARLESLMTRLIQQRKRARGHRRGELSRTIDSVSALTNQCRQLLIGSGQRIAAADDSLTTYNMATGWLRDYIAKHCPPQQQVGR